MKLENKTVEELKNMCRNKKISGYSKLNKQGLVNLLNNSKKVKKGGSFSLNLLPSVRNSPYISQPSTYAKNISNLSKESDIYLAKEEENQEYLNRIQQKNKMKNNIIAKEEHNFMYGSHPKKGQIHNYQPNNSAINRRVSEYVNTGNWKCIGHNNTIYGKSIKKINEKGIIYHIIRKKSKSWF